jgi:hypothetical protein
MPGCPNGRAGRRLTCVNSQTANHLKRSLYALFFPIFAILAVAVVFPARYNVHAQNIPQTDVWAGYALLKRITSCESWGDPDKEPREFAENGSVLHGYPNPNDIGLGQINVPTWGKTAQQLGFNLYTYEGNLNMAKWIFNHYGPAPWKYSEGCWGKYENS